MHGPVNPNDVDGMVFHILGQILVPTSGPGKRSRLNEAPSPSISHFASFGGTLVVPSPLREALEGIAEERADTEPALADAAEQFALPLRVSLQECFHLDEGGGVVMVAVLQREYVGCGSFRRDEQR
jgi:hypothetical protein